MDIDPRLLRFLLTNVRLCTVKYILNVIEEKCSWFFSKTYIDRFRATLDVFYFLKEKEEKVSSSSIDVLLTIRDDINDDALFYNSFLDAMEKKDPSNFFSKERIVQFRKLFNERYEELKKNPRRHNITICNTVDEAMKNMEKEGKKTFLMVSPSFRGAVSLPGTKNEETGAAIKKLRSLEPAINTLLKDTNTQMHEK
jgi:hypothetical protein